MFQKYPPAPQRDDEKFDWLGSIPMLSIHALGVAALFLFPARWDLVALCMGSYFLRIFGVTAGYHRYFAHRAFKTSRPFQFLLAFLAETSAQKGMLWWSGNHRDHHRFSDTEKDIHSPIRRGFWWSHIGWILCDRHVQTPFDRIKDFAQYPELRWLNKYNMFPPTLYAVAIFLIWGTEGLFWGMFLSTTLLWHGTFTINSLCHVFGRRRFNTKDTSRNSLILSLVTWGEGWHNNHHYYHSTANQGFYWWQVDITYYVLRAMAAVRLVWDLRKPPERVLALGRTSISDQVRDRMTELQGRARALAQEISDRAGQLASEASDSAGQWAADIQARTSQALNELPEKARAMANEITERCIQYAHPLPEKARQHMADIQLMAVQLAEQFDSMVDESKPVVA